MKDREHSSSTPAFQNLLDLRLSRRGVLALAGSMPALALAELPPRDGSFIALQPLRSDAFVVPFGYSYDVIARDGDAMLPGATNLEPKSILDGALATEQAAAAQLRRFGWCTDGLAYFPISGQRSDRGVLCANNESVHLSLAFPRSVRDSLASADPGAWIDRHPAAVKWMQAAHGVSIVQVARGPRGWKMELAALNRRITTMTPCDITGPARGSPLLRTRDDPTGTRVLGTIANCAGGRTPWGTYLTAEENIDDYFGARPGTGTFATAPELLATYVEAFRRFPLRDTGYYGWERVDARFDVAKTPNEALRFGWIVEIDPHEPRSTPKKRTALGRFSHEGANTQLAHDGRVAAYMGDDEEFEYVYKFVTKGVFNPANPAANRDLLDDGTLYVARFDANGTGEWRALVHDESGPLNSKAGFASQADVVVKARAAADLLGATPMDRPEDIAPNAVTGRIYISCTKNPTRGLDRPVDAANPRPTNRAGHVIEIIEEGDDAAAVRFHWNVFLLAGDPRAPGARLLTNAEDLAPGRVREGDTWYAGFADRDGVSPFFCPDNLGVDPSGRLWIVTDTDDHTRANNGCFVVPTTGPQRGRVRQLASGPRGAELSGCEFTPDGTTLFLSIQHPGEGGSLERPTSDWPDGDGFPARSALVAVRRDDGRPV